jgi:hypothetical protein
LEVWEDREEEREEKRARRKRYYILAFHSSLPSIGCLLTMGNR